MRVRVRERGRERVRERGRERERGRVRERGRERGRGRGRERGRARAREPERVRRGAGVWAPGRRAVSLPPGVARAGPWPAGQRARPPGRARPNRVALGSVSTPPLASRAGGPRPTDRAWWPPSRPRTRRCRGGWSRRHLRFPPTASRSARVAARRGADGGCHGRRRRPRSARASRASRAPRRLAALERQGPPRRAPGRSESSPRWSTPDLPPRSRAREAPRPRPVCCPPWRWDPITAGARSALYL